MAQLEWTESALDDLDSIAEYIALDNPLAASKFVRNVFEKADWLENFPESGRKVEELPHLDYRELVINPVRLIYKISDGKTIILAVIRQERNLLLLVSTRFN